MLLLMALTGGWVDRWMIAIAMAMDGWVGGWMDDGSVGACDDSCRMINGPFKK